MNELSQHNISQIETILEQIGTVANTALGQNLEGGDPRNTLYLMMSLFEKIGWHADLGLKLITGSEVVRGDAEAWMLPKNFNKLVPPPVGDVN